MNKQIFWFSPKLSIEEEKDRKKVRGGIEKDVNEVNYQ